MAATTLTPRVQRNTMATALGDSLALAARNLRAMSGVPQLIVFSTIQPVIFVLMFRLSSRARSTDQASTTSTT